jgi:hypothetical protein
MAGRNGRREGREEVGAKRLGGRCGGGNLRDLSSKRGIYFQTAGPSQTCQYLYSITLLVSVTLSHGASRVSNCTEGPVRSRIPGLPLLEVCHDTLTPIQRFSGPLIPSSQWGSLTEEGP